MPHPKTAIRTLVLYRRRGGGRFVTALGDSLLVQRAAEGDLEAFEALVRRYQLQVIRVCNGMLNDPHEAQDAAQDTFFTAWRSIGRFRGEAQFSTWLYRIATNRCLKQLRRNLPTPTERALDQPSAQGNPPDMIEASERYAAIAAAVKKLAPDQRAAFLLRDVEGLPYNEIAEVLGVSMTAAKSRIYRARLDLARQLDEQ
jgi:RNA polymerase sigma-70 factor, ECF subfamily